MMRGWRDRIARRTAANPPGGRRPDDAAPYSVLAPYYDQLMEDVDYEAWADFLDEIIQEHHPAADQVHEIACGTGSMALSLDGMGCYTVSGSDKSAEMVRVAAAKAVNQNKPVRFEPQDFLTLSLDRPVDVIYCVFDSVNYLVEESDVVRLLDRVRLNLEEDGILIFDFTTPNHSLEAAGRLNGEILELQGSRFAVRRSWYEESERMHRNEFRFYDGHEDGRRRRSGWMLNRRFLREGFNVFDPEAYREFSPAEVHVQKAYGWSEMQRIVERSVFELESAYEEFSLDPAGEWSNRITMVCR
jgi:ubiquinone/menaquinone biosynthesis C-methylase UbiE